MPNCMSTALTLAFQQTTGQATTRKGEYMWYEYGDDDFVLDADRFDYEEIKEDLVIMQGLVDDTIGQGRVYIYLDAISPVEYEVYFDGPEVESPVFESNPKDLLERIKEMFAGYNWVAND